MTRDVMLVGSVPLKPAMSLFKCACEHGVTPMLQRMPDGEQHGWVLPLFAGWRNHPALEPHGEAVPMTRRPTTLPVFATPSQPLRLKAGHNASELELDDMGIARGFATTYEEFTRAKAEGLIPPEMRFVATLPSPGTVFGPTRAPAPDILPVMSRTFRKEIARILEIIPHRELAIQLDLAAEAEAEEYRRRPEAWDMPGMGAMAQITFDEAVAMIAEIANAVPQDVELGFHLCAIYHIDESQGQDLNVHVDWANALTDKINRRIDYIHMPTTPDFDVADFEPLRRLKLNAATKLYLGVIHAEDGVEGALRRTRAAASVRQDFGIASFCGLVVPSRAQMEKPVPIETVLDMHREVAQAS